MQHDALLAGGGFSVIGGLLVTLSLLLPWLQVLGESYGALELFDLDVYYLTALVVPFLGAALVVLSLFALIKDLRSAGADRRVAWSQTILAMSSALLVIWTVLLLQQDYAGSDATYGAGAFLCVVGAILVMAGSLMMGAMPGVKRKAPTGFQALAKRSSRPEGEKGWKPPETSVKLPRCPTCGEELHPSWMACPNCGRALVEEREGGRL